MDRHSVSYLERHDVINGSRADTRYSLPEMVQSKGENIGVFLPYLKCIY